MGLSKRRVMLGAAGVLAAFMISGPVAAAGAGHGTVDVNDVTSGTRGGIVQGSDGNERNILYYNSAVPFGSTANIQGAFLYEEAVEFDPNFGMALRYVTYDEQTHPKGGG